MEEFEYNKKYYSIDKKNNDKLDSLLKKRNDKEIEYKHNSKYIIDIKEYNLYSVILKDYELNSKEDFKSFDDIILNFNEILHAKVIHIYNKNNKLRKMFINYFSSFKKFNYLKKLYFFENFNIDVFLSNVYIIHSIALFSSTSYGKDLVRSINGNHYSNKRELINAMSFFPKYNERNLDIADYINSMSNAEYMNISLFSYIKIQLTVILKNIMTDEIDNKDEIVNTIHTFIENLHEMYIYSACIIEEIIILSKFIENKYQEIDNKLSNKHNNKTTLKSLISLIFNDINQYFKISLDYYYFV